jgi:cytochrome c biogenesis protein CcdA
MATISILMALAILASHLLQKPVQKEKTKNQQSPQDLKKILLIIASFGFYTGFLTVIGFDIATFLFISATLWIQGKQKVIPVILYAFLFTLIVVLVFKFLLPYPMKTVVF